jgi:uncharacterized membrane protein YcaP (DUF421 family)
MSVNVQGVSGMNEMDLITTPLWEIAARGTVVYLAIAVMLRLTPTRQTGSLSPNDMIALVIIGTLAADAIIGEAKGMADLLLMVLVIMLWDYLFNLAEFYLPRYRRIAQHEPTLLIHNGMLLHRNLQKEKLTEEELMANLRKRGFAEVHDVRLALLEADGEISVLGKD